MNISRNKLLSVLAIILLTSMCASFSAVLAHNPAINIPTTTYAYVAPNPIGVGQSTTFVYYLNVAPPDAAANAAIRWNWTLTVTDPNNVVTNLGQFLSDVNGFGSTTFTPTIAGTWQLKATFPNTLYTYSATSTQLLYTNDTFQTSTFTANFTVSTEPVVINTDPLPSNYWSAGSQGDWFKIVDNNYGPSSGQSYSNHQANIDHCTGSVTGHMLWVQPVQTGGQVGGKNVGAVLGNGFYQGLAYNSRFLYSQPIIILNGLMYYKEALGNSGSGGNFIVFDMRTGQIIQRSAVSSLGIGYSSNGVTCVFSSATFGTPRDPATLQPLPWTVTGAPSANTVTGKVGDKGEIYRFALTNVNTTATPGIWNVLQWNSSKVFVPGMSGTINAGVASAYDFNVTIKNADGSIFAPPTPAGSTTPVTPRVYYYELNDFALLTNMTPGGSGGSAAFGRNDTWNFWTVSLKQDSSLGKIIASTSFFRQDGKIGTVLPVPNINVAGDLAQFNEVFDVKYHVIPLWSLRTNQWFGLNTLDGTQWGPSLPQAPFDYYAAPDNTAYNRDSFTLDGYLFSASFAGVFYCFNASTGERLFTYGLAGTSLNQNQSSAGLYTLYNGYPVVIPEVSNDQKLAYIYVNEHSPNVPELKNSYVRCVNITNGEELWMGSGYGGVWTTAVGQELIGNGYTVALNSHNMLIQCFGLGPSATTVKASNDTVVGGKMIIEGTVMDTSPGTKQLDIGGRYPDGVPAVQEGDNMTAWMEYLYMHHEPKPDVKGVDVTLVATDASGTSTEIGTVTTDSTGYYSFMYTPSTAGSYMVTAAFKGSTAYAPSTALTSINVAAPSATPTPTPTPTPAGISNDTYVLGSTAAIIVVIAIVTAVIALMLRKKP